MTGDAGRAESRKRPALISPIGLSAVSGPAVQPCPRSTSRRRTGQVQFLALEGGLNRDSGRGVAALLLHPVQFPILSHPGTKHFNPPWGNARNEGAVLHDREAIRAKIPDIPHGHSGQFTAGHPIRGKNAPTPPFSGISHGKTAGSAMQVLMMLKI